MDYHLADAEGGRAKESLLLLRDMVGEQIHQAALPLPQMRLHRALALLALPVVPRLVIG